MHWFDAPDYGLSRLVFQRGLAAIYLIGFLVAANQFRALLGANGLLPIPRYVARVQMRQSPSLFHLRYSDRYFALVAWTGAALAAATVAGLADVGPLWTSLLIWAVLWALYLSIVNVGQTWYGFGWESLLLETGFLAIFLGNARVAPPVLLLWLLRWLLFRVEFGAGLIKLRGDRCWRDLTCLRYHHETQPMPGPFSWYFHRLPDPLHRVEVAANHAAQLGVPFLLFTPQPVATVAAALLIVTQLWLVASGNFAWLNWLTIVIAVSTVDGSLVTHPPHFDATPRWYQGVVIGVSALIVVLSYRPAGNLLSRRQIMNYSFDPLHLVNTYGAFGSISRQRDEVVLEGTADSAIGPDTAWREYEFKGKPGDPRRRPPQVAPYHLRLDWLMWFVPLSPRYGATWLPGLLGKLLVNDRSLLRLLRLNPFPDVPPVYVRAVLFRYRYTTRAERRATGAWWSRTELRELIAPVSLDKLRRVS
ncbi:MAG TPA: lipase maturation factor family protein [Jatrophihabitantaceae bacterium]